jgi:hypothetical protein
VGRQTRLLAANDELRSAIMSVDTVRDVLLWSGIMHYGLLVLWALLHLFARDFMRWVGRLYRVPPEQFDVISYAGIALYKTGILMFFLIPYVALRLVG